MPTASVKSNHSPTDDPSMAPQNWEHPAVRIRQSRFLHTANAYTLRRLLANALAFVVVVLFRESTLYGTLLLGIRRWSSSTIYVVSTYATHATSKQWALAVARYVDYAMMALMMVLLVNCLLALRLVFFPPRPPKRVVREAREIPLTEQQRKLLGLDASVGNTVQEKDKISPTKAKPLSALGLGSEFQPPANALRSPPQRAPSTINYEETVFARRFSPQLPASSRLQGRRSSGATPGTPGASGRLSVLSRPATTPVQWRTPSTPVPMHTRASTPGGGADLSFVSAESSFRATPHGLTSGVPGGYHESPTALRNFLDMEQKKMAAERLMKSPPNSMEQRYYVAARHPDQPPMSPVHVSFGTFQPASKSSPAFVEIRKRKERADLPTPVTVPFEEVQALMELSDLELLAVSKRLRQWLREKVVVPLVQNIKEVDGQLTAEKMEHLTTRKASSLGSSDLAPAPNHSIGLGGQPMPLTLNDLQARFGSLPLVQQRLKLEHFLLVPRATTERTYIVDRLQTLANDIDLGPYTWDGGAQDGTTLQKFSAEMPSDAEILFHVFGCFMDDKMRALGIYPMANPFTSQFVTHGDHALTADDIVRIHIVHRYPLQLTLTSGKQMWEISEGRNNLFYTLSLFVKYYLRGSAGYLDTLYLGGSLGLSNLFATTDT